MSFLSLVMAAALACQAAGDPAQEIEKGGAKQDAPAAAAEQPPAPALTPEEVHGLIPTDPEYKKQKKAKTEGTLVQAAVDAAKALRKTAESGFAFAGEVVVTATGDQAAGGNVLKMLGMSTGEPISGKLAGAVAAPFRAVARIKSAGSTYELFRDTDRITERLTCRGGAIEPPLDAAVQLLFVLDLQEMAKSVETVATRIKAGGEASVGDVKCRRFDISLPEEAISGIALPDEFPVMATLREGIAPEKTVDVMAWVGLDDGQVHRLQVVFHYKPRNNGRGFTGDINHNLTLKKHGAAEVVIPSEVKPQ